MALFGSVMYLGGTFNLVQGSARSYTGAINTTTGAVLPWNPDPSDTVSAVYVTDSIVYIAGNFLLVGGQGRPNIAAVDTNTGGVTGFTLTLPGLTIAPRQILKIGDNLIVAGDFASGTVQARNPLIMNSASGEVAED